MKKNISINICGTIYSIDEDAYELLEHYLGSMKRYFSQEGDEDIADDIEHRVAELLWNKKQEGSEAVTIEMVKEIIETIGNPADIAGDATARDTASKASSQADGGASATDEDCDKDSDFQERFNDFAHTAGKKADTAYKKVKSRMSNRKLYRDGKNKIIGGVCAGCAEYFGGDPVVWRLVAVLATLIVNSSMGHWFTWNIVFNFIPVMYVILCIIVPVAKTPEDKIRMKGQEVTPETLKEQIVNDMEEKEPQKTTASDNGSGCLKIILGAILLLILQPLIASMIAIIIALFSIPLMALGLFAPPAGVFAGKDTLPGVMNQCGEPLIIGLVAGLFIVGIPIYAIIRTLRNSEKSMSTAAIVALIITWISALVVSFLTIGYSVARAKDYIETYDSQTEINVTDNSHHNHDDTTTLPDSLAADSI